MRFKHLDLNLLHVLNVLIEEQNVSRAADRLNVSQPTMSAALARLREYFDDPLLVQQGRAMMPTSQALQLQPMIDEALRQVNAIIAASHSFDPLTSKRRFYISASDFVAVTILSRLVQRLHEIAPGIQVEILPPQDDFLRRRESGEIDLLIFPAQFADDSNPAIIFSEEKCVVAGCRDNPLMHRPMTEDEFYAAPQIGVTLGQNRRMSFSETQLRARGRAREVEVMVSSFLIGPEMLPNSDRLLMMPERLALLMSERLPIAFLDPPFPFPVFKEVIQYHASRANDHGLQWLIAQALDVADYRNS